MKKENITTGQAIQNLLNSPLVTALTEAEKKDETPQSNWAGWALLQAAEKPGALEKGSLGWLLAERLGKLFGHNPDGEFKPGPRSFVVYTNCGHWGRGNTLEAAAKKAYDAGASKTSRASAVLVLNDATPEVNQGGSVISESDSEQLSLGVVGTIGSIINANAKK